MARKVTDSPVDAIVATAVCQGAGYRRSHIAVHELKGLFDPLQGHAFKGGVMKAVPRNALRRD